MCIYTCADAEKRVRALYREYIIEGDDGALKFSGMKIHVGSNARLNYRYITVYIMLLCSRSIFRMRRDNVLSPVLFFFLAQLVIYAARASSFVQPCAIECIERGERRMNFRL